MGGTRSGEILRVKIQKFIPNKNKIFLFFIFYRIFTICGEVPDATPLECIRLTRLFQERRYKNVPPLILVFRIEIGQK